MPAKDPIKDLMDEIAAEEAADDQQDDDAGEVEAAAAPAKRVNGKKATVPTDKVDAEDEEEEVDEEEAEEEPAKKVVEEPKKPRGRFVPISRLNETAAKQRTAERRVQELEEQLAAVEKASKEGKTPLTKEEREEIATSIRSQERVRVRAENMVNVGYEEYGQKEFDGASSVLADLGAPDDLILLALESCGSSTAAARALYNLSQDDADKVEALFKLSPLRMAAQLAGYAEKGRRPAKAKGKKVVEEEVDDEEVDDEDEIEEAQPAKKARQVSRAPEPARPVKGTRKVDADSPSDDDSEDEFTEKFDRMMNKKSAHRAA